MLVLYNSPQSTCSQKVRMVLAEKGLVWEDKRINFRNDEHLAESYLKLNPNGVVPTLIHDGNVIIDSSVIAEYLDDVFPEISLRPAGPVAVAHMRAWRQFIDEVPTHAIRYPSFNAFVLRIWAGLTDEQFQARTKKMPLRRHLYGKLESRQGFSKKDVDAALDELQGTVQRMEAALSQGAWLIGDRFTLADVAIIPTIVRMEDLNLSHMWRGRTNFCA
jgi:glutathione S-transferase